ncbi:MAG: Crp/Fnr family transcriptional regulator [Bacteroidetes bacterium]|nr:Crp/Fnr family transcriptional regulator [Bacteroidota bacterium]
MPDASNYKITFEPELIQEIENRGKVQKITAGSTFLDIGDAVRNMPLIMHGTIKVMRQDEEGHELLLYYVNPSESCAMTFTCCMQQYPSEIRAVAETDVEMILLPISVMDEWLVKYPTWKAFVMKTFKNRFDELLRNIDQIAFQKLDDRLVLYLKQISKSTGSTLVNLTHEQIATDLGSSRVVISRLLKRLENDRRVILYRNQIKLMASL